MASFPTSSGVRQGFVVAPTYTALPLTGSIDKAGVNVGQSLFTDIDYADDAARFAEDDAQWTCILESFNTAANTMGLHILGKN